MQSSNWLPVFARVLIPIVTMMVLQLVPIPHLVYNHFHQAYKADQINRPDKAAQNLREVLAQQPWRIELLEKIGIYEFGYGQWSGAIEVFEKAREVGSISNQSYFDLGEAYFQAGQPDTALQIWEALLSTAAANDELFARVIGVQRSLDLIPEQIKTLEQWISFTPVNTDALYELGLLLLIDDPIKSMEVLAQARNANTALSSKVDALISALNKIKKTEIESYRLLETGRALGSIGEWEIAQAAFRRAVEYNPEYAEGWAFLAEACQQLGEPALDMLVKANTLSPDSVLVKALSALYWRRQNDPAQAMEVLEQIITMEPDQGIWLVEMGYAVAQKGDLYSAMDYFQRAVNLEPENPVFWREIIRFCLLNSFEIRSIALPAARQYLLLDDNSSPSLDIMGWVMMSLEDIVSAKRYFIRAIEGDPTNSSAHLHLGQMYLAENNTDQAFIHLSLAAELIQFDPQISALAKRLLEKYFPNSS